MKKWLAGFVTLAMALSVLAGCGSTSSSTAASSGSGSAAPATGKANTVAFCTMTAEGDYWNMLYNETETALNNLGYQMEIINANGDIAMQNEQIDNCVTQGYAGILLIAVEPEGVADACRRAIDAGTPVLAFIKDPGEGNRTAFRGGDEVLCGQTVVSMAMDWVDAHWPDAEPGSINAVIIGGNSVGSETERFEAMVEAAAEHPALNILESGQWETSQSYSMQASENLLTKYNGEINVFLVGSGEMALGVREAIMAANSPIKEYADVGIFTMDMSAETAASIRAAANDEDVIRAAGVNGGILSEACAEMADQMVACINGTNESEYAVTVYVATADNLAEFGY